MLALALVGASLVHTRTARAELSLRWDAPTNCPQRDEMFERIRKLAGPALEQSEPLAVEGTITPEGGRYRLTLVVRSGSDQRNRVIASDSCADLAGAAAITVALLLGVDASTLEGGVGGTGGASGAGGAGGSGADASKQGAAAASSKPPPETKPDVEEPPRTEADDASDEWGALLRVPLGALDVGPLPRPAFGVGLGGGARHGPWRFVLTGRGSLEQTANAPDGNFGAELRRLTGELLACRGWRSLDFEVAPCVVLALEHLNARGSGNGVSPSSQRTTWLAPGAGVVGHWYALESLAFFLGVTGYVELSRPRLVVEGFGEVVQLSPAALGLTIGAEWIL